MTFATRTLNLGPQVLVSGVQEKNCHRCGHEFLDYSVEGRARVCVNCKHIPPKRNRETLRERHGQPLTVREAQVSELVAQGKPNKEIAAVLHVGEGTIKVYMSVIMAKTGAHNRTELAVQWAVAHQ